MAHYLYYICQAYISNMLHVIFNLLFTVHYSFINFICHVVLIVDYIAVMTQLSVTRTLESMWFSTNVSTMVVQKALFMSWSMSIFSFIKQILTELFGKKLTIDGKYINKRVWLFIHQALLLSGVEEKKLLWH